MELRSLAGLIALLLLFFRDIHAVVLVQPPLLRVIEPVQHPAGAAEAPTPTAEPATTAPIHTGSLPETSGEELSEAMDEFQKASKELHIAGELAQSLVGGVDTLQANAESAETHQHEHNATKSAVQKAEEVIAETAETIEEIVDTRRRREEAERRSGAVCPADSLQKTTYRIIAALSGAAIFLFAGKF